MISCRKARSMSIFRIKQPALFAVAIVMLCATAGYAQEDQKPGSYIDGVFVENYVYKPQFIPPRS